MNIAIFMDCGKQNKHIWEDCSGFCRDFPRLAVGLAEEEAYNFLFGQSFFIVNFAPTCYHNKVN